MNRGYCGDGKRINEDTSVVYSKRSKAEAETVSETKSYCKEMEGGSRQARRRRQG